MSSARQSTDSVALGSKRPRRVEADAASGEEGSDGAVSDAPAASAGAGKRPALQCSYEGCDKIFMTTSGRKTHEKSAHEGVEYLCSYEGCDKIFTLASNRLTHEKSAHEGQV